MKHKSAFTVTEVLIVLVIVGLLCAIFIPACKYIGEGAGAFGPTKTQTVIVERLYVDYSGSGDSRSSHYMVGTDKGVFEADNSLLLWIWNADEIYAKIKEGRTYNITTRGNRVVGFWLQEYPYITSVSEVTP